MKTSLKTVVTICGAVALVAQAAVAGHQSSQGSQSGQSSQQQSGQSVSHLRLSKFIGTNAKSNDGQNLGEIKDILVNPQTGQITFALLGKSGAMGAGQNIPVPWQAINVRSERDFVVNVDQQKLQTAPTVDEQRTADLNSPDYVIRIYRFYAVEPPAGVGAPGSATEGTQSGKGQQQNSGKQNQ